MLDQDCSKENWSVPTLCRGKLALVRAACCLAEQLSDVVAAFLAVINADELASLRTELRDLRQQWQEARAECRAPKGVSHLDQLRLSVDLRAQTARADESAAALEASHQEHAAEMAALRAEAQAAQESAAEELRSQRRALVSAWSRWRQSHAC